MNILSTGAVDAGVARISQATNAKLGKTVFWLIQKEKGSEQRSSARFVLRVILYFQILSC